MEPFIEFPHDVSKIPIFVKDVQAKQQFVKDTCAFPLMLKGGEIYIQLLKYIQLHKEKKLN